MRVASLFLGVLLAATSPVFGGPVILVSVDGLRPDAIDAADTPTFDRLRREGAYSAQAETIFPSITLPSHASMLSGQPPEVHGILFNSYEPRLGSIRVPTCLSLAHDAGLETVAYVAKEKLRHLLLPDASDRLIVESGAERLVDLLLQSVESGGMPDFAFVHFKDPDSTGHRSGWMSAEQLEAVARVDRALGKLVSGLAGRSFTLIVTADHGGHGRIHGTREPEDVLIPWLAWGKGVRRGCTLPGPIVTYDTAPTVLYLLGIEIPDGWRGRAVIEAFDEVRAPRVREF